MGPITALTFMLTVDPSRREVGAYLGLVPRQRESGERAPQLGIGKSGDAGLRRLLVQAAHYILGPFGPDTERYAGTGARNAKKRAVVAVARRLAVLLLALWKSGEFFNGRRRRRRRERRSGRKTPSANEATHVMPNTGDCERPAVPSRTRQRWQRPLEAGCAFMHRARCAAHRECG